MRLLYENELKNHLMQSKEELIAFASELINSNNANNWQKANELSFLLRKNNRNIESVEISRMMFEKDSTVDKLNLYFVAVVDQGDINEIKMLHNMVDQFLNNKNLPYQKHLFATWLKAANRILDDQMFEYVYQKIPSLEKTQNSYIISQYYVYKNRHSQYEDVIEHYNNLGLNVKNAKFVKKYYLNACSRMGLVDNNVSVETTNVQTPQSTTPTNTDNPKIFIVYGNDPVNLHVIKSLLSASNISFIDLKQQANKGQTIIEKFEAEAAKTDFAIVLCTPENEGQDDVWYPRQNVIFEWGYFTASLGRKNVCLLYQENQKKLELPSDTSGIVYISMDKGTWLSELSDTLKCAGFKPNF